MENFIGKEVIRLGNALDYNGFDTIKVREEYKKQGGNMEDLIKLLVSYVRIGNNHQNLMNKVKEPDVGKEILTIIKKYKISERCHGTSSSSLTLPRLASAYSPVLLKIRELMISKKMLRSQFDSNSPLLYQDLALSMIEESHDFCLKFSKLISRHDRRSEKSVKLTDEEIESETKRYIDLAVSGLKNDDFLMNFLFKTLSDYDFDVLNNSLFS
jgi:hypothetical protein